MVNITTQQLHVSWLDKKDWQLGMGTDTHRLCVCVNLWVCLSLFSLCVSLSLEEMPPLTKCYARGNPEFMPWDPHKKVKSWEILAIPVWSDGDRGMPEPHSLASSWSSEFQTQQRLFHQRGWIESAWRLKPKVNLCSPRTCGHTRTCARRNRHPQTREHEAYTSHLQQ